MNHPILTRISPLFPSLISFVLASILLQIGVVFSVGGSPVSFIYLVNYLSITGIAVTLLSFVLTFLSEKVGQFVTSSLYIILLLVQLGLASYFLSSKVLLGADLFGYSFQEIVHTVSTSSGLSVSSILLWLVTLSLFFGLSFLIKNQKINNPVTLAICGLLILGVFLPGKPDPSRFTNEYERSLSENASLYFFRKAFLEASKSAVSASELPKYPFLHDFESTNPLGSYFNKANQLPNIVFITVEGLGGDFVGPNATLRGFTPFLDSLITKSLYWETCVSSTGRTFGALPTILGSLPMGTGGFMNLGTDMPAHATLFSLLKSVGYQTSFFYGGNANFDGQDIFLEAQGTDLILQEKQFPDNATKQEADDRGFSWGYPDRTVFDFSLEKVKANLAKPRVDFYLTLTTHEPFNVPEDRFKEKAQQILKSNRINEDQREIYSENLPVFECILYTDDAIRSLIRKWSAIPGFERTIFIITGDHRLIPISSTRIKRFHVPLIVYSPLILQPTTFKSIAAHAQLPATVLGLLSGQYGIETPKSVAFMADEIQPTKEFSSNLDLALMRNKNELQEYIDGEYLLSENSLYKISDRLESTPITNNEKLKELREKLALFDLKNKTALFENRLIPDSLGKGSLSSTYYLPITNADWEFLKQTHADTLSPDSLYFRALHYAQVQKFEPCRTLLRKALNVSPNYEDLRILYARSFAWQGNYDSAFYFLDQVMERSVYEDTYVAYSDVAYWNGDLSLSLNTATIGLENFPESVECKIRVARGLLATGASEKAKPLINEVLKKIPNHELGVILKKRLNNI